MLIRSQNRFCRLGREGSTRTPKIFPLPQNLNSILTSWAFRLQGRGFWPFFSEGPEKFFAPAGPKKFLGGTKKNSQVHRPSCRKDHSFV